MRWFKPRDGELLVDAVINQGLWCQLEENSEFATATRQVSFVHHQQAFTPVAGSCHVTSESLAPVRVRTIPRCVIEAEEEDILLGLKNGRENSS